MPEDSTPPSNTPRRHRPRLTELASETTEEDLWDLDDDSGDFTEPSPAVEEPREPLAPESPEPDLVEEEPTPRPEPVAEPTPTEEPAALAPEIESSAPTAPEKEAASPPQEPSDSDRAEPTAKATLKPDGKEKVGLIILAVVFLGLGIWWVLGLLADVPTTRLGEDTPDFPIEGSFIEATTAESYWRAPIRDGENPDVARADIVDLPVLAVTISGSGDGVLRAIFRDDEGEFVGDSITRSFTSGQFDDSRSATAEFPATSGFTEASDFNAYRVGADRWTVEILEGPSAVAAGREFKTLFIAPISSIRR